MARKRVGLLYDYTFARRPGGAQRLAERIAGHVPLGEVDLVPCPPGGVDLECDGYALLLTKNYSDTELAHVVDKPFVRYELDYWRDIEPQAKWRDRLNEAARSIMFCSPLHRDVYWHVHPARKYVGPVVACPMELGQLDQVRLDTEVRSERAIWFGTWNWNQGPDVAQKWAMENETHLDMYSPTVLQDAQPDNEYCTICGFGAEADWWQRIAQYPRFVMMPRTPQPFPYAPLEAYALGLELVLAGRFGIESFGNLDKTLELAAGGADRFWDLTLNSI